ncbi:MAG: LamG-like jellyroll fold domain-containing protein, partial [Gammaproteobacteria bacterium]
MAAQGNEADIDGTVVAFVVQAVTSGTLKIGSSAATATAFNASTNNIINATNKAFWTPDANANGTLNAFTVRARDDDGASSGTSIQAQVDVNDVNDAPTVSLFSGVLDRVPANTEVELTLADLLAQADEADVDGTVDGFVVQALSSGTLNIGANAGTATPFVVGVNDTIDAANNAYWTPDLNATGDLNAFTVKALDDDGDVSTTTIQAQVQSNALPTLTAFASVVDTTDEDTEVELTFADLAAQGDEADSNGTVDGFVVQAVSTGTLKIGATAGTATAFAPGTNDTIDANNHAYWTPDANANGTLNAFTVTAIDDLAEESITPVQVQVEATAVNDAPVLTASAGNTGYTENAAATVVDNAFTAADVESDHYENFVFKAQITANGTVNDSLTIADVGNITLVGTSVRYGGTEIGILDATHQGVGLDYLQVKLNANADDAAVTELGRAVSYLNSSDTPSTLDRTVTTSVENLREILFVSDSGTGGAIADVLEAEGYTVTRVMDNFDGSTTPALHADLSDYVAVYWSASGTSGGDAHTNGALFTNLSNYVSAGGRVFITGYDSIASPDDPNLYGFLGGTAVNDGNTVGTIVNSANSLTTGVVDIRGLTPSGGETDLDHMTLGGGATGVVNSADGSSWTLRSLGDGEIAYVSNGQSGTSGSHASWSNTSDGGAGVYNAALRNFALSASSPLDLSASTTKTVQVTAVSDDPTATADFIRASEFNGSSSYVDVGNGPLNNLAEGTIEVWVYLDSNTAEYLYAKQRDGVDSYAVLSVGSTADGGGSLAAGDAGKVYFHSQNSVANAASNATLSTGQWHHVAVTFTTTEAKIYINGVLDNTVAGDYRIPNDTTNINASIGGWPAHGQYLDGKLRDMRFWDDVRTADEIKQFMGDDPSAEVGLLSQYLLGDTDGTAADTTGNLNGSYQGNVGVASAFETDDNSDMPLSGIAISDVDAGSGDITVQFNVASGKLTASAVANGATQFAGNGTGTLTITGTVDEINTTLAAPGGLLYRPDIDGVGNHALTVTVNDQGNTGTGGGTDQTFNYQIKVTDSAASAHAAIQFDGSNDQVVIPNDASINFNGTSFSFSFWSKLSETGANEWIIGKGDAAVNNASLHVGYRSNGKFTFAFYFNDLDTPTAVADTDWHHWAGTYDATNNVRKLYMDGRVVATDNPATDFLDPGHTLYLGRNVAGLDVFDGLLDNVSLWNKVLTEAEVLTARDTYLTGNETGLVAYYRADSVEGTTLKDLSANTNDGTLTNGPEVINTLGRGIQLDGVDDHLTVADHADLDLSGAFTLEAWIKLDTIAGDQFILDKPAGDNTNVTNYRFYISDGKIGLYSLAGGISLETTASVVAGEWVHVAAVFDGANTTFYANGVAQAGGGAWSNNGVNTGPMYFGRHAWGDQFFDGQMDEVRIWNDVRTADEIAANYNRELTGSESNLAAYYRFDDLPAQGGTTADEAGTDNTATLVNQAEGVVTAPEITGSTIHLAQNTGASGFVLETDADAYTFSSTSNLQTIATANGGSVSIDANTGHWVYTPPDGFQGTETFTIRATNATPDPDETFDKDFTVHVGANEAPAITPAVTNVAAFDGVDDYVDLPDPDIDGDVSLEAWVWIDSYGSWSRFVELATAGGNENNNNILFGIKASSGELVYALYNGGTGAGEVSTNAALPTGRWVHVAAVQSGTTIKLYVDGAEAVTTTNVAISATPPDVARNDAYIGRSHFGADTYFDGKIRDVRIWNDARTSDEIAEYRGKDVTGQDNLAAWYKLDEADGTAVDSSGNGLDGTYQQGVTPVSMFTGVNNGDISLSGIVFDDDYGSGYDVTVTFGVGAGNGSLIVDVGAVATSITGSGTESVTIVGTIDQINTILQSADGLVFRNTTAGEYLLTVTHDDGDLGGYDITDNAVASSTYTIDVNDSALSGRAAIQFDGVDSEVDMGDSALFQPANTITLETWINPTSVSGISHVMGNYLEVIADGTKSGYSVYINNGTLNFGFFSANSSKLATSGANLLQAGEWSHVAATWDGTTAKVYINGREVGSTNVGGSFDFEPANSFRLGHYSDADSSTYYTGLMEDVRVWNIARTADQILDSHTTQLEGNEANLVGYYRADSVSGDQLIDLSSNQLNGTMSDGVEVVNVLGRGIELDGTGDHLTVADDDALDFTGAFSLEAWIKLDNTGGIRSLIDKDTGADAPNYRFIVNGGTLGVFSDNSPTVYAGSATVVAGQWAHVAVVFDGTNVTFYQDGVALSSSAFSVGNANGGNLFIGKDSQGREVDGQIDEVRLWNDARTASEIADNYNQQLSGNEDGLAAYYRFDDLPGLGGTTA